MIRPRRSFARHALAVAIACVGWSTGSPGAASAVEPPTDTPALPGTVVRWPGEEIDSCGRGGSRWDPVAESCWFAIDLLEAEGSFEVFRFRRGVREKVRIRVAEYPYPVQRITIEDTSRVDLSPENLERVRKEQSRIRPLWSLDGPALFELPLTEPLDELGAAGSFGSRRFFNDQPRSPHSGADYPAAEGAVVYSAAPGRVVLAADLFFSGNSVFIDHGAGLISMYFHLSSILVEEGQLVGGRELIGRAGATGRVTGPHLHFGLRWRGARVDPSQLLGPASGIPEIGR